MERLSALMDGELHAADAERELGHLIEDAALRERWDTFHLIGDAMRGNAKLSGRLVSRVAESLVHEPTVFAPQRRSARRIPPAVSYALSAAASLSAVAVVAWVALSGSAPGTGAEPNVAQVASVNVAPVIAAAPGAADTSATHEYLLAHQGVSPSTALQGVAPYVRTVTMNQQIDGR